MEYAKDLIISFFDLLLANEYKNWSIGSLSAEEYFELRIFHLHHHCLCGVDSAQEIIDHFTSQGLRLNKFHPGVIFLKEFS